MYERQKELILLGERVVLATLGFDLNVHHPYKPLVEAIKKFKVAQNALAQVAWNFVNDGYGLYGRLHALVFLLPIDGFSPFAFLEMGMWYADCGHLFACNLSLTILRPVPFSLLPNFSKLNSHQMGKRCGGKSLMSPHGNWRVSVNAFSLNVVTYPKLMLCIELHFVEVHVEKFAFVS